MPPTDDARRKRADAVAKSSSLLPLLLQLLRRRVEARSNLRLHPPAATLLKQLDQAKEQLGKLGDHAPHSREAVSILVGIFDVVFDTLDSIARAPLHNEPPSPHWLVEQPAEPALVRTKQTDPNQEMNLREMLKSEVARIKQDLGHPQTSHAEHVQRPPESKPGKRHKPETHDPNTPR